MICNFNVIYNDKKKLWMCEKCGYIIDEKFKNAKRECVPMAQPQYEPTQLKRITNFIFAYGNHLYKGMPTCNHEEVENRLKICKECPLFKNKGLVGGICLHENCGCNIKDEVEFLNKLAWKDQTCPLNKWSKIE